MDLSERTLKIGELARQAAVGVETVRFYEREGLLEEPPRRESGYRAYPQEALQRLLFVRGAKRLGFSLREIRDLLDLWDAGEEPCEAVRRRIEDKLAEVRRKILALRELETVLDGVASGCRSSTESGNGDCPVLETLGHGGDLPGLGPSGTGAA
ncbi:MAG: heavy metal-responsive transcriptional regulator [Thermoanaerobaculia bacterium]